MNTNKKKPVFWVVIVAIVLCVVLAVVLGTNPKSSIDADKANGDGLEQDGDVEATTDSDSVTDQNGGTDNGQQSAEDIDSVYSVYFELVHKIEDAMYNGLFEEHPEDYLDSEGNPICSSEFYHLYDGSGDIAYQNRGYLIKDIDNDGTPELLLGENKISGEEGATYDGVIYDLYTVKDGELVHVFDGWSRNRFYLTEDNDIVSDSFGNIWSSSAFYGGKIFYRYNNGELEYIEELIYDYEEENKGTITYKSELEERELYNAGEELEILEKYTYVYPQFIPMGTVWTQVQDLSGDGRADYIIYYGNDGCYNHIALYIVYEGIVFEHEDACAIGVGAVDSELIDIDHDGEKEIFFTIYPNVNSMPLEEYAVIKKTLAGWQELEVYVTEGDDFCNAFPIHMYHDDNSLGVRVSCDGLDKSITFDVEYIYDHYVKLNETSEVIDGSYNSYLNYYEGLRSTPIGSEIGSVSAWGIWTIKETVYNGQPCLIAEHGIEGYSKFDSWGLIYIYFDYDMNGKIRVLDMVHEPI